MNATKTRLLLATASVFLIGTLGCRTPEQTCTDDMEGMSEHPSSQPSEHPAAESSEHPNSEHPEHPAGEHPQG